MSSLKHAILGAGGIGGLMAANLSRTGASVTLVVRPETLANYPKEIQLDSPSENFRGPVECAAEVPACDVLWLTVKATQLSSALTAVRRPESIGTIVPLLNGIDHLAVLRSRYRVPVIGATIAVESERIAPGHFDHRSPFVRLNVSSAGKPLLGTTIEEFQSFGFECRFIDDEPTLMWSKLVFLGPFALSTTASDKNIGEMLDDSAWKALGLACIREACAVAVAEGAKIDADAVVAFAMKMHSAMRSSMQKDVEQGNAPELDAIAGPILRGAQKHGIEIPATKKLVAAVEKRAGIPGSLAS